MKDLLLIVLSTYALWTTISVVALTLKIGTLRKRISLYTKNFEDLQNKFFKLTKAEFYNQLDESITKFLTKL